MIRWFKETLRDYKKESIKKHFSQFSKFKGESRIKEFRELGLYMKSIQYFSYKYDCLDKFLERFDCIKIDEGWHIGQDLILKGEKAKYPFLYAYKDEIPNDWSFLEKKFKDIVFNGYDFMIKDHPDSIYLHLKVTPSVMGAWQVYLLEYYPLINNAVKNNKCNKEGGFVFSYADLNLINKKYHLNIKDKYDLSPYVWMKDNIAYVTCCHWLDKSGLQRDIFTIIFDGNRVKDIIKDAETIKYIRSYTK